MTGTLFLIPNFIGNEDIHASVPADNILIVQRLRHFIIESPKPAHLFLKKTALKTPFTGINFFHLNEHTRDDEIQEIIKPLMNGEDMGLLSDAGYPVIADPGEKVVRMAHLYNVRVVPLAGASSILLALAASGLNAEQFVYHGYLPVKTEMRRRKILQMEKEAQSSKYTQIFIETPYRNKVLFDEIKKICLPATFLCVAVNLYMTGQSIRLNSIANWRKNNFLPDKAPCVFLIGV